MYIRKESAVKSRSTYKTFTLLSVFFPLNRIYLGTEVSAGRLLTGNYLGFGWLMDLMYMDKTFDEAMAKRGFMNTDIRNWQGR
jgi:hypothetical protein